MHEDAPTADDLPHGPGTLYAVRNIVTGGYLRCGSYEEAHAHWQAGAVVYTKSGEGSMALVAGRDWEPVDPPT